MKQATVIRNNCSKKFREMKLLINMSEIFETAGSHMRNPKKMKNYQKINSDDVKLQKQQCKVF